MILERKFGESDERAENNHSKNETFVYLKFPRRNPELTEHERDFFYFYVVSFCLLVFFLPCGGVFFCLFFLLGEKGKTQIIRNFS